MPLHYIYTHMVMVRTLFFFFLFHTLVKVVDPEAIRICRTLLWNLCIDSSSTRRKHCAVLSFVTCRQIYSYQLAK